MDQTGRLWRPRKGATEEAFDSIEGYRGEAYAGLNARRGKQKKMAEEKANWAQEQDRSQKLEAELKAEKERLRQKREEEKIAARRVIIENEEEKRRRIEKQEELKR